jgi:hypothetical protein
MNRKISEDVVNLRKIFGQMSVAFLYLRSAPLDARLRDSGGRHEAVAHDPAVFLAEVAPEALAHWVWVGDRGYGASHALTVAPAA